MREATLPTDAILRLPIGSAEADAALVRGVITVNGVPTPVVPTAIDEATGTAVFSPVDRSRDRPRTLALWWRAIRPISLTATATPAVATLLLGLGHGWTATWWIALLALGGALSLQAAVNLENDVEDHRRLIDLPGGPGGAGVIQRGWLTAQSVERGAFVALALGVLCGLPTLLRAPGPILVIGGLGVLGAFGYSGRPFGMKYRALGDLAVLVLCGPGMTLGMSYAAFGQISPGVWLLGGTFGLLAVAILHANNLEDRELDQKRDAVTVAQLLGARGGAWYFALLYAVALALPFVAYARGEMKLGVALAPLVGLPLVLPLVAEVLGLRAPRPGALPSRVRAAQTHLALGLVITVALAIARWL